MEQARFLTIYNTFLCTCKIKVKIEVHFLTPVAVTYLKAPVLSLEQESLSFLLSVYFFTQLQEFLIGYPTFELRDKIVSEIITPIV